MGQVTCDSETLLLALVCWCPREDVTSHVNMGGGLRGVFGMFEGRVLNPLLGRDLSGV